MVLSVVDVLWVVVNVVFSVVLVLGVGDVEPCVVDAVTVVVVFSGKIIFSSSKVVIVSSVGRFRVKSPGVEVVLPMLLSS